MRWEERVTFRKWFSTIFFKASKLEMEWNSEEWKILWRLRLSNGVYVKERKNGVNMWCFSKSTSHEPPYHYIASWWPIHHWIKVKSPSLNPSHWITLLYEKVTRLKQLSHNKSRNQLSRDATNENHKNIKPTERMSNVTHFQNLSPNLFPRL